MKLGVYTFPHGISLNGRVWALEGDEGEVALFDTEAEAVDWLNMCLDEPEYLYADDWEKQGIHIGEYEDE